MSCGGIDLIDDYVPPVLRITTPLTQLTLGNTFQFEASYFNNVGELITNSPIEWESANTAILKVDTNGTLDATNANGAIFANNIESFVIGGEMGWNLGSKWGVTFGITTPLYGKVIYKASSFSGGIFLNF